MSQRLALPNGRNHVTQKVLISDQCTLYLSLHNAHKPAKIYLPQKGSDRSCELIGIFGVIVRLMSLALRSRRSA